MFEVVILVAVPELVIDQYNVLFSLVSLEKQERIKCFRFFRDACNCLMGDVLVRSEISRVTGLSNKQLGFVLNPSGKPFLINGLNVHFNISHAGNYVVCALSDSSVGIDIEFIRPIDEVQVAECFFSSDEKAYVSSARSNLLRNQRFFEVWTKKESRIKWEGKGLSKSLPTFNVLDTSDLQTVFYHCVYHNEEVICHVCSDKKETPSIRVIDTNTLLQQASLLYSV
jgi:4'-phosphopantetheinyl transferase